VLGDSHHDYFAIWRIDVKTLNSSAVAIPNATATGSSAPIVISFASDPNSGGGVSAPLGSLGMRTDVPSVYVKTSTGWSVLPPGSGPLAAIAYSGSASDLVSGTVPAARMPALTGDVTTTAGSTTTTIAPGAVSNAKLRNSAATSVIGRATNTSGSPADIAATADGQVLQRIAGALTFATLNVGAFYDTVIDYTFTSSFDNVNLGTLGTNTYVRCAITGGPTIAGFTGGADGKIITLYRNDAGSNVPVFSNDSSTTASNGLLLPNAAAPPTGQTIEWRAQCCKTFRYDGSLNRWVCLSSHAI